MDTIEISIRPSTPRDEAFVYDTWLKGAKLGTYEAKRIRDVVYYPRRRAMVDAILARGGQVLIAHPPDDPDTILGCLVYEDDPIRPVLHWLFVKLAWRKLGIATRLLEHAMTDPNQAAFTCWTVWELSVPAGRAKLNPREAKAAAVAAARNAGTSGGDMDDLLRKWPHMQYDPDARFVNP